MAQEEGGRALSQVIEEAEAAAAIHDDGDVDFVPEPSFEVAGRDAEIAADIDDDGADGPAAHLLGDFFLGGEACETRVLGGIGGPGVRRCGLPYGAWRTHGGQADGRHRQFLAALDAAAQPGFQHCGATQATGDTGEDDREVGSAEGTDEPGKARGAGALLDRDGELLAVVDQFAHEAENAAEAGGRVRAGPGRIGLRGWGGKLEGGGHERNKNINGEGAVKEKSPHHGGGGHPPPPLLRYVTTISDVKTWPLVSGLSDSETSTLTNPNVVPISIGMAKPS